MSHVCDTFDCAAKATHIARWQREDGTATGGRFCSDCAWKLQQGGDDVRPPILADVVPFRGGAA